MRPARHRWLRIVTAQELKTAATRLREPLPAFVAMPPRIVMGESETMNTLAWDTDHEGEPSLACWGCDVAEFPHEQLAELAASLLTAREHLADLLDAVDWLTEAWAAYRKQDPGHAIVTAANAIAAAVNGSEP